MTERKSMEKISHAKTKPRKTIRQAITNTMGLEEDMRINKGIINTPLYREAYG